MKLGKKSYPLRSKKCHLLNMNRLVLFDLDGTLFRGGNTTHSNAFSEVFKTVYQENAHIDEIMHEGKIDSQIIIEVLEKRGFTKEKILGKLNSAFEVMTEYFDNRFGAKSNYVLPGAKKLLSSLQENDVYLGVLTGNLVGIARKKLKSTSLDNFFLIGAFGNEALRRVDLVEIALKKATKEFGIHFNKKAVFIIGDTPLDIECGRNAAIKTIGVASGTSCDLVSLRKAGADLTVPNFMTDKNRKEVINFILK